MEMTVFMNTNNAFVTTVHTLHDGMSEKDRLPVRPSLGRDVAECMILTLREVEMRTKTSTFVHKVY